MLTLGQSARRRSKQHIEQTSSEQREKDSEAFARRVALLIDSMHSAAIDVGKILSDEVDEKAWDSYLKGNRGVFTRRAVRLLDGGETRAIRAHYETDLEFQQVGEPLRPRLRGDASPRGRRRDGGMIAVTLMSSDMGKLYAALAQAVESAARRLGSAVEVEVVGSDPAVGPVHIEDREQHGREQRRLEQVPFQVEAMRRAFGLARETFASPTSSSRLHAERQQQECAGREEQEVDRENRRQFHRRLARPGAASPRPGASCRSIASRSGARRAGRASRNLSSSPPG